jgi:hypothetical protein
MLVVREYDVAQRAYRQTTSLCGGEFLPVLEVQSVVPAETWRLVPPSTDEVIVVDHTRGTYEMTGHRQHWALDGFPPDRAWPASRAEVDEETFMTHVFDLDDDDHPGVTVLATGIVEGEIYAAERKTSSCFGVVVSEDRALGRSDHLFEVASLGASLPLLDQGPPQINETDPEDSWFDEIRIAEGATCDDVIGLVGDGTLGDRPF